MATLFNCPHCEQPLDAPEEMRGQQINCPSCRGTLTIPISGATMHSTTVTATPGQTRACPFCGETVLLKAGKCKHCGEFLDESLKPRTPVPEVVVNAREEGCFLQTLNLGCLIVAIVLMILFLYSIGHTFRWLFS